MAQSVRNPLEGSDKCAIHTECDNGSDEVCSPEGSQEFENPIEFDKETNGDDELRKSELDSGVNILRVKMPSCRAVKDVSSQASVQIDLTDNRILREDNEPPLCSSCGHDAGSEECCRQQHPSKRVRIGATSVRAGERQRQEDSRLKKEQLRLLETASTRPRNILSVSEAVTPAQKTLAKLRERVTALKQ